MKLGIFEILHTLGAFAFLIYGMKLMSDGIQRLIGNQLQQALKQKAKNRIHRVVTGFLSTFLLQSSSVSTVIIVSFVNAGILYFSESAGIIIGVNIGATFSAWFIAILGFKMNFYVLSIPLLALAIPMLFSSYKNFKYWGELLIGLAIIFISLNQLQVSFISLSKELDYFNAISQYFNSGFLSRFLLLIVGIFITGIVRSSNACIALTFVLVYIGWLPLLEGASLILGANIGTTITAEIASINANVNARKTARLHTVFNVVGVLCLFWFTPQILIFIEDLLVQFGIQTGSTSTNKILFAVYILAAFHTLFNVVNAILFLSLLKFIQGQISKVILPRKRHDDHELHLISTWGLTSELSIIELQEVLVQFGDLVIKTSGFATDLINSVDSKERNKLLSKISKYEQASDDLEVQIIEQATKLYKQESTSETSRALRNILSVSSELEKIADIYVQISNTIRQKVEIKAYFTPDQRNNLNEMIGLIDAAYLIMNKNLSLSGEMIDTSEAEQVEKEINKFRNKLRQHNVSTIGHKEYSVQTVIIYNNLYNSLEQIGDHIMNVTEALKRDN